MTGRGDSTGGRGDGSRGAKRRDFDPLSEAQVAAGRTQGRWVAPMAGFRPAAPLAVSELLDTIQHVAEAATGERSFLHLQPKRPGAAR